MFIGLSSTLSENPEDVFHKKMLLREYFKKYQNIEDRNAFDKEVEIARLTNPRKYNFIVMFFGLMAEEMLSKSEEFWILLKQIYLNICFSNEKGEKERRYEMLFPYIQEFKQVFPEIERGIIPVEIIMISQGRSEEEKTCLWAFCIEFFEIKLWEPKGAGTKKKISSIAGAALYEILLGEKLPDPMIYTK